MVDRDFVGYGLCEGGVGSRGMKVGGARQSAKDRKEWRALNICEFRNFDAEMFAGACVF